MNKSIFFPTSMVYLTKTYLECTNSNNSQREELWDRLAVFLFFALFPIWIWFYFLDIIANAFDIVCFKVFVEWSLYAIQEQNKMQATTKK